MENCNHVAEAERALIGGLILSPEYLARVSETVRAEDFSDGRLGRIYQTMREAYAGGAQIDIVTLSGRLGDAYLALMKECVLTAPTAYGIPGWAALVREESARRQMERCAVELIRALQDGEDFAALQVRTAELSQVSNLSGEGGELSLSEGIARFCAEKRRPRTYITTGFGDLDRKTYIDRGDYVVIGGRPSSGKTAFALNLALHMSREYQVVFFSLETKSSKIMDRFLTAQAGILFENVKRHTLTDEEWKRLGSAAAGSAELRFTVVGAAGRDAAWIAARAMKLKADIIIVDYLGLVQAEGKSRYEKVTNISVGLHVLAQSYGMTVIALSQLNRGGAGGVPGMEDLRESGQIEQDADLILLLHNDRDRGKYSVIVAKNKDGSTGAVSFQFDGARQRFLPVEERHTEWRDVKWKER